MKASKQMYRKAIMLSNKAISILQSGFVDEATKAINGSLSFMQLAFPAASPSTKSHCSKDSDKELELLVSGLSTSFGKRRRGEDFCRRLDISPVDEEDFSAIAAAAKYGSSSTVFFPVLLSSLPEDTESTARQLAAILYNRGLIYFIASREAKSSNNNNTTSRKSDKLLSLAITSLSLSQMTSTQAGCMRREETLVAPENILSILFQNMVLNCLGQAYHTNDLEWELKQVRKSVSDLENKIQSHQQYQSLFVKTTTAAAA